MVETKVARRREAPSSEAPSSEGEKNKKERKHNRCKKKGQGNK